MVFPQSNSNFYGEPENVMNNDWTCLTPYKGVAPKHEFGTTPNKAGSVSAEEAEWTILLLTEARSSEWEDFPSLEVLKARIAARKAREEASHNTSRWLKRLATEDPTILFPPADQIRPEDAGR
jgi:hypothetical protein